MSAEVPIIEQVVQGINPNADSAGVAKAYTALNPRLRSHIGGFDPVVEYNGYRADPLIYVLTEVSYRWRKIVAQSWEEEIPVDPEAFGEEYISSMRKVINEGALRRFGGEMLDNAVERLKSIKGFKVIAENLIPDRDLRRRAIAEWEGN